MASVSTIILSWENPTRSLACVHSVIAAYAHDASLEGPILVVDNGSSPKAQEELECGLAKLEYEDLELLRNPTNLGYSAGMNRGIRYCQENYLPDYYWLLNNDLTVAPDSMVQLVRSATADRRVKIWGPTVISSRTNKLECAGGCRYFPTFGFSFRRYRHMDATNVIAKPTPRIDYIYGAAIFLDTNFIERIGGLDESFYLYFEELELARNLGKSEFQDWCRSATVFHDEGGSSSIDGVRDLKTRQAALSAFKYTYRHHPSMLPSVIVSRLLGIGLIGILTLDFRAPVNVILALGDFFRSRR